MSAQNHDPKFTLLYQQVERIKTHRVFELVRSHEDLRTFMQWHVFAVWDFMSLAKRLQQELTCTTLPWLPPARQDTARLINEIVLGEETDLAMGGGHASHFDLYLGAMEEVQADTRQIRQFISLLRAGRGVGPALAEVGAPAAVKTFVEATLETALNGSLAEVLGNFYFGREDLVPQMFRSFLEHWKLTRSDAPTMVYYLDRHIELDTDEHGPAAQKMMQEVVGDDPAGWAELVDAAADAIEQRYQLWEGLARALESQTVALAR